LISKGECEEVVGFLTQCSEPFARHNVVPTTIPESPVLIKESLLADEWIGDVDRRKASIDEAVCVLPAG
jgi:hypothetical protein